MIKPPVIIAMVPRSGSSMVARIFHEHGLWIGKDHHPTPMGYANYENTAIKEWIKYKRHQDFDAFMKKLNPNNCRWMFKAKIRFVEEIINLLPNYHLFKVVRKPEGTIASSVGYCDRSKVIRHVARLDSLKAHAIDSDALIAGDYRTLKKAFDIAGMELDLQIVERCIDRSLWHNN